MLEDASVCLVVGNRDFIEQVALRPPRKIRSDENGGGGPSSLLSP